MAPSLITFRVNVYPVSPETQTIKIVNVIIAGVYFIKKGGAVVSKEKPAETLIIGDLSNKLIDQLASLVDEVNDTADKELRGG